jgi:translin
VPGRARRTEVAGLVADVDATLDDRHQAREAGLALCRTTIRESGSSIRAVHRQDPHEAEVHAATAESALRSAQQVLEPFPSLAWAGYLHDAEKEYSEARLVALLVSGASLLGPTELGVDAAAWLKGLAEAASELRRHLLDRLRAGELDRGEELLAAMDDVYDALVSIDYPDAVTNGLRRSVDALRAVVERTRGDVTATVQQERLRSALERLTPPAQA